MSGGGGAIRGQCVERHPLVHAAAPQILEVVARTPDLTLAELRAVLAGSGVAVGMATLWRLLDRHRITRKKRPRTRPSRTAPTS